MLNFRRFAFIACLLILACTSVLAESTWTGVARIVAVGDIHGDYGQLVAVLRAASVMNDRNKWIGGKTHLVQIGDLNDRGTDTRKVMDLIMDLEDQARRAGGFVHALMGNHETMAVYGDLRYVSPKEFESFRDANSEQVREAFYERYLKQLAADPNNAESTKPDEAYRKAWEAEHPLGYYEQRFQFGPNGKYGKWIRTHDTIIKINDTIFVHGGISPKYADLDRETINNKVRAELADFNLLKGGLIQDPDGPLWYRELASGEETVLQDHVRRVLDFQGAKRIVIGHTPTSGAIVPRFGGKVILIDVGLSAFYGSHLAFLLIEGEKVYAVNNDERLLISSHQGSPREGSGFVQARDKLRADIRVAATAVP